MDPKQLITTDLVLSEKTRLAIMALLAVSKDAVDFVTLLEELGLTKGNLSSHLRKLEEAEYITVDKQFINRIPRSTYQCTAKGRKAVKGYLAELERVMEWVRKAKV